MKPFDLEACKAGKRVVTRDGREFKFGACWEGADRTYRVIGWLDGKAVGFHFSGRFSTNSSDIHAYDLFMAPTKVVKWVNLYRNIKGVVTTGYVLYASEQEAKSNRASGCITTVPVEWEE